MISMCLSLIFTPCAAVDVLHLGQQVLLQGLLAADAQDVVRDERAFDQRVAGLDVVAGVHQQVLVLRHVVLASPCRVSLRTMMVILPRRLSARSSTRAGDLGHDGRLLGLAGLEDLGDARQTAGDVLRAGRPPAAGGRAAGPARPSGLPRPRYGPWPAGSGSRGSCRRLSSMMICGCFSPLCSMTT